MLTLKSKSRTELGRDTQELRQNGFIPAVLYGPGIANKNIAVDIKEFVKMFRQSGKSSLISLAVEGEKNSFMVLINDIDTDPVSGNIIHADLYQPDLTKEIEAEVPLVFEGESPAVKDLGGTLVKNISDITVKALPADLPREIKVDISKLATFEDAILVKDLIIGDKVELLKNPDEIVALAAPVQKVEEELEKPIEEKVEEVGTVEKKEKDVVTEEEAAPTAKK
ncbi:MAG: 50S ribosomal protein L25 [Candidatus Nealsonbacteria bacterium DGGOD1a]|jgi:ribosomal protein L25, Ctc-form|nr:MAG: 50S ribosomal protein L25 [Candidatus Nealsonbacteria bacterium DGGOD1a]